MSSVDGISLRGGSYIGNSYWSSSVFSWPFVTLTITSDRLDLAGSGLVPFHYTFPKAQIDKLVIRGRHVLSGMTARLEIVHRVAGIPPYVVFGTFAVQKLLTNLASSGFAFTEAEAVTGQMLIAKIKPYVLAFGALIAIGMGMLFKWRMLGFLRGDTLLSGGRSIQTTVLAHIGSMLFFILGGLSGAVAVTWIILGCRRKRTRAV